MTKEKQLELLSISFFHLIKDNYAVAVRDIDDMLYFVYIRYEDDMAATMMLPITDDIIKTMKISENVSSIKSGTMIKMVDDEHEYNDIIIDEYRVKQEIKEMLGE